MSLLNIGGVEDPAYRYKMPRTVGKKEGNGNGTKTVIVNADAVAKALKRPPEYLVKYCGLELGAQSRYDKIAGSGTVNGHHDTPDLQKMVDNFIRKFVLCPRCNLPETVMVVDKKQCVVYDCKACGYNGVADMTHKLMTFVVKNPPNVAGNVPGGITGLATQGAGVKQGKSGKKTRAEKERDSQLQAELAAAQSREAEAPQERAPPPPRPVQRDVVVDENDWSMDVSDAAVEARRKEIEAASLDDSKKREEIAERIEDALDGKTVDQAVAALKAIRDMESLATTDVLGFVFEAVFDEEILKQIKGQQKLLVKIMIQCPDKDKAQEVLLVCIQTLCCVTNPELEKKLPVVLKAFYDLDLLEEEMIFKWHDKKPKGSSKEVMKKARAAALPFVTWLREADSDSEEDDSD